MKSKPLFALTITIRHYRPAAAVKSKFVTALAKDTELANVMEASRHGHQSEATGTIEWATQTATGAGWTNHKNKKQANFVTAVTSRPVDMKTVKWIKRRMLTIASRHAKQITNIEFTLSASLQTKDE